MAGLAGVAKKSYRHFVLIRDVEEIGRSWLILDRKLTLNNLDSDTLGVIDLI